MFECYYETVNDDEYSINYGNKIIRIASGEYETKEDALKDYKVIKDSEGKIWAKNELTPAHGATAPFSIYLRYC